VVVFLSGNLLRNGKGISLTDNAGVAWTIDPTSKNVTATITSTAPGGTTGQVQYNNAGAFGGAAGFTYTAPGVMTYGAPGVPVVQILFDPSVTLAGFIGNPDPTNPAAATNVYGTSQSFTGAVWATSDSTTYRGGGVFQVGSGASGGGGFQLYSGSAWSTSETIDAGTINLAGGYALSADGTARSSDIRFLAGAALQNAPLTFHVSNGGSGYTDGTYSDSSQLGIDLEAYSATTGAFIALQSVKIVAGAIVSATMNYPYGASAIGDVLDITLQAPSYSGAPGTGAQLTVDTLGNGLGGQLKFVDANGGHALTIDVHGELLDSAGNPGTHGQVPNSQGTGSGFVWGDNPTPILAADTIADGATFQIADSTNIEMFLCGAPLAAATVAMPLSPADAQQVEFTFDYKVTALTVTATQTIENVPTRAMPGMPIKYVYYAASTTWKRKG
jgi:hypothetical protein